MNGGMTRRFHKLGIRWRRTVSSTLQALNRLRTYLGYPLDTKLVGLQVVSVVALEKRKCSCLCRKYNSTFSVIRSCALHRSIELSGCFYYMNALKTRRKFTLYTHTHTHTHALLKRSWVNILCEIHNDKTGTARKRNRILHNLVNKFDIKFIVSVFIYSFIKFHTRIFWVEKFGCRTASQVMVTFLHFLKPLRKSLHVCCCSFCLA